VRITGIRATPVAVPFVTEEHWGLRRSASTAGLDLDAITADRPRVRIEGRSQ
jgi:hypothetical protein